MGTAEMQQCHKEPRPETAAVTRKQEKCQRGPETVVLEVIKQAAGSSIRIQTLGVNTVEGPATVQAKEETAHSLRARDVG
jgi:hypothetical protein